MKNFLKTVFATFLGNLVATAVLAGIGFALFVALLVGVALDSAGRAHKTPIPDDAFLVLDLSTTISDTPDQHDGSLGNLLGNSTSKTGLWDILSAINEAATDSRIRGIFIKGSLETDNYGSGFAALAEVRRALLEFKKNKKPVIAYLDDPSLKNYYLATAADTLYVHPYADVDVRGLASSSPYLGNALKKYGIGIQTTKVGKYKSAIEPLISDKMSDADREQRQSLYNGIWADVSADIAAARQITPARLQTLSDERGVWDASSALAEHLVDKTAYLDEVLAALKELGAEDSTHESFAQVHIRDYIRAHRADAKKHTSGPVIAIVYAEGDIVDGSGLSDSVGGDALAAQLREIRHNEDVAAVVLRVNSPGGSAFASEVIQREVRQLAAAGKPVTISMGSLAASGGYWISAFASKIYAEKTTITGSIGVFGLMFNVQDAATSLGVNFDGVKTSRFADIETLSRPKTPDELALLQRQTDRIYDDFIAKVAEGRRMDAGAVREIAQGRVWSGDAALRHGLVDAIGGLGDAVRYAAGSAKLSGRYEVRQYPESRTALETFTEIFFQPEGEQPVVRAPGVRLPGILSRQAPVSRMVRQFARLAADMEKFNDRRGVYARLPWWELERN
jgi:protease-4